MIRDVPADTPLSYSDVQLPRDRQIDELREQMVTKFFDKRPG